MNRRGFLGSCAAAVLAPFAPKLLNTAGAVPEDIIGYMAPTTGVVPVEFADGTIRTWTVTSTDSMTYPYMGVGRTVTVRLPQRFR